MNPIHLCRLGQPGMHSVARRGPIVSFRLSSLFSDFFFPPTEIDFNGIGTGDGMEATLLRCNNAVSAHCSRPRAGPLVLPHEPLTFPSASICPPPVIAVKAQAPHLNCPKGSDTSTEIARQPRLVTRTNHLPRTPGKAAAAPTAEAAAGNLTSTSAIDHMFGWQTKMLCKRFNPGSWLLSNHALTQLPQ